MGQLNYTTAKVNELLAKMEDMPDSVEDGKTPVLETGTTQTLAPGQDATSEVVANGEDENGNPKYKLNFGIPRGADGKDSSGTGGGGGTADEVDWNNVQGKPSWVNSSTKPTYTAEEVGALPSSTKIPAKTSQLENDSGFLTGTSLKTVNGHSLVGSGDITVGGGEGSSGGTQADAYFLPEAVFDLSAGASQQDILTALGGTSKVLELEEQVLANGKQAFLHKNSDVLASYTVPVSVTRYSFAIHNLVISYSYAYRGSIIAGELPRLVHACIFLIFDVGNQVTHAGIKVVYEDGYELGTSLIYLNNESTSEEVSAAIGGLDGLKAAIQAVKDGNRLVIRGTPQESLAQYITAYNCDLQVSSYSELENGDLALTFSFFWYAVMGMGHGDVAIFYTAETGAFSVLLNTGQ